MKSTTLYDFNLVANGTQVLNVDANFYKVLTSAGDIAVRRDSGSEVKPIRAGRGERDIDFQRLVLRDLSGAPNSGTILVGDSTFIDDTIVLSSAINIRPEAQSGFFSDAGALVANTGVVVFAPGANVNGAILLSADIQAAFASSSTDQAFISKASAPTSVVDGSVYLSAKFQGQFGTTNFYGATLPKEQYIPAGQGLYFISTTAVGVAVNNNRACRYKFL